MKVPTVLVAGLPKKELVERIHFHQRQGEVAERSLGFYLLDLEKRKLFRPYEDAAEWARKHLPQEKRPDKLILLARRLEKLPAIEAAFNSGEIPWTKIRDCAFPPRSPQGGSLQGSPTGTPKVSGSRRPGSSPPGRSRRRSGGRSAETAPEEA